MNTTQAQLGEVLAAGGPELARLLERTELRLAADPEAYSYLPSSVRRFPGPSELAAEMAAAGLEDVRWLLTAGGIIAIHAGTRPPERYPA